MIVAVKFNNNVIHFFFAKCGFTTQRTEMRKRSEDKKIQAEITRN